LGIYTSPIKGCQMVYFHTKFLIWSYVVGRASEWKKAYFISICNILRQLGKFYGHLEHFVVIWYIFSDLVCCIKKKPGNPVSYTSHIQPFYDLGIRNLIYRNIFTKCASYSIFWYLFFLNYVLTYMYEKHTIRIYFLA
jgi:hypothetical protein